MESTTFARYCWVRLVVFGIGATVLVACFTVVLVAWGLACTEEPHRGGQACEWLGQSPSPVWVRGLVSLSYAAPFAVAAAAMYDLMNRDARSLKWMTLAVGAPVALYDLALIAGI
jgi:hypothetical protein